MWCAWTISMWTFESTENVYENTEFSETIHNYFFIVVYSGRMGWIMFLLLSGQRERARPSLAPKLCDNKQANRFPKVQNENKTAVNIFIINRTIYSAQPSKNAFGNCFNWNVIVFFLMQKH